jgi:hypothetical protein
MTPTEEKLAGAKIAQCKDALTFLPSRTHDHIGDHLNLHPRN